MIAERGLTDADLDALFAQASAAEAAGRTTDALGSLIVATAELLARGSTFQYPFEWMARLESALGNHDAAERSAMVGRAIAVEHHHGPGTFRMDVLRADLAREALDLPRAEAVLAELAGDGPPLGAPSVERFDAIVAWLRALRFRDHPAQNLAVLRVETALTIAELWFEQGRYVSALRLIEAIEPDLGDAAIAVRVDQVQLLQVELLVAAGQLAEASQRLATIRAQDTDLDRARVALVRARAALVSGRLAEAISASEALRRVPPGVPLLFAAAAAARVAVLAELNLLEAAQQVATTAIAQLSEAGAPPQAIDLLERARRDAAARGRSAMALWELPSLGRTADPPASLPTISEPTGGRWRLTAAWTGTANQVLLALERGDVPAAGGEQAKLAQLARGIESEYVACRVELSAALVAYYGGDATADRFLAVADRLRAMGARIAEAQAVRFAAWASAREKRFDDYAALARRASALVDAIAGELDPENRAAFLMNKWNGRDELVTARVRELLRAADGQPRRPRRGELCRAFREIDELTHWPVDDALGDRDAATLASDATPDRVLAWVRERLDGAPARARAQRGISIRSVLSLWRVPARTLILHYHVLPDRTYLFRIARRHIDVAILPVGRVHLAMDMREVADDAERLRWLAAHTGIAEAIARFDGIRRLVIVPHDAMAGVPFAALPIGDRRLCAITPITQIDRLMRLQRRRARPRTGPFLSVGRTSYQGSGHPDLPCAEREAAAVAKALGCSDEPRREATRLGVLAELPNAARFHIAAHGQFDTTDPARSGIVLGDGAGGYATLTLRELRLADLRRLQLATLATCRSAEHAKLPGRERICLPIALLDAGARGVIASLWPVEDEPSVELMTALYQELRTQPPARALAAMQVRMGQHPVRQWAGLVFYGNE
jgi:hypothetical protein